MTHSRMRGVLSTCVAGTLILSASASGWAAPVSSNSAAVKSAVPGNVTDVHWRGRGGAVFGGLAAGLMLGAIAGAAARPYYYDPGYAYYGYPAYGYPAPYYSPPPVYAAPPVYDYVPEAYVAPRRGGPGQCWVQTDERGYGFWRPC